MNGFGWDLDTENSNDELTSSRHGPALLEISSLTWCPGLLLVLYWTPFSEIQMPREQWKKETSKKGMANHCFTLQRRGEGLACEQALYWQ